MVKAAFIGLGSMGGMLANGFISSGMLLPADIVLSTRTKAKLDAAQARWPGIRIARTNLEAAAQARHVFVCVKPEDVPAILAEIKPAFSADSHIISIAGSVSIASIESITGCAVTRVIPTVLSEVGGGVSLVSHGGKVQPEDGAFIERLFGGISTVKCIPESQFTMATELTSCMPGFIASIFQEVVEAALRHTAAIDRADAEELVLQTLLGTSRLMAEKHMGFEQVIERVATKGGITQEGVDVLRAGLPQVLDDMFRRTLEKRQRMENRMNGEVNEQ